MLKPFGSFSFAVGNLSGDAAIGNAGTGANFASTALSGIACCHDGGGGGACADAAGAAAGACAAGAGGLTIGCEPGPAPRSAESATGACVSGVGLSAGGCSATTSTPIPRT